jgi:hypothetical protein
MMACLPFIGAIVASPMDIKTTVSICINTTLMITLHQEVSLHARYRTEDSNGDVVGAWESIQPNGRFSLTHFRFEYRRMPYP